MENVFGTDAWEHALVIYDRMREYLLLTREQALMIPLLVALGIILPIVHRWTKYGASKQWQIVGMASAVPITVLLLLLQPSGFVGQPDDECQRYAGGKLLFTLLTFAEVPTNQNDVYGKGWL